MTKKRCGTPRNARTPAVLNAVEIKIARNPVRMQKLMAIQMSVKRSSPEKIINEDLGLHAYCRRKGHFLNECLKAKRRVRICALLER